jgi:hypothetical protein
MPDPREWIARVRHADPPDLWNEAERRARIRPAAAGRRQDRSIVWGASRLSPRVAALVTGVAAGVLALTVVLVSLQPTPPEHRSVTPAPSAEPSTLLDVHHRLEKALGDLWTTRARADEVRGEIVAAQGELDLLTEESGTNPTARQEYRLLLLQERIRAWQGLLAESEALISALTARVEAVRVVRDRLVRRADVGFGIPDVAVVTCDGDATGGTHLLTPIVRTQPDGVHIRVVNHFSAEPVFLVMEPGGVRAIPPGETRVVVIPPGPSHDAELVCTYEHSDDSWERPTHPLWIEDLPSCADDIDRLDAAPVEDVGSVSVYFSCEADADLLGAEAQPVYMFARSIPEGLSGTADGRLEAALRAYFDGPTPEEVELDYFSPAPPSLGPAIQGVSISDGIATVDFDGATIGDLGGLGTSTASLTFLLELRAVTFQFPEVQQLVLQVDGDCDSFWHMLEMSCQTISRHEGCPIPQYIATRLPWLSIGTRMIPGPERVDDRFGSSLVWFEDEDLRWSGGYVSLKRSSKPPLDEDLSGFPAVRVQAETAHLVWIGDPGVGILALVWSEGVQPCSWFSLIMSTTGITESQAEHKIRVVARSLSAQPPGYPPGLYE